MNEILHHNYPKKYILLYNFLNGLFMTVLIFILIYTKYIYLIGSLRMYPIFISLIGLELVKYLLKTNYSNEIKMTKTRKISKKFKVHDVTLTAGMLFIVSITFYAIAILFGAPMLSNEEATLMFSLLLTILTVVPSCFQLGPHVTMHLLSNLTTNYKGDEFSKSILRSMQFTLVGAWLGAVVIPLDWDRPWQVWPIPCSTGALFGYTLAGFVNIFLQIK